MAAIEMPPPRLTIGPFGWLKKNLFSSWYNTLLTFLVLGLLYALLRSVIQWSLTEARWGVISANLTLFMVGQYPRDQLWRVWFSIYLLGMLLGLSWGIWKDAARGFALIALGAGLGFALIGLLLNSNVWINWLLAVALLLAFYALGRIQTLPPRARSMIILAWLLYFPLVILLIAGSRFIPFLVPVPTNQWGGLLLTLMITIIANFFSLPLGILVALGRRSKLPIVRYFSIGYIELIRGVPLVTVLFMAHLLVPLFLPVDIRPPDAVIRAMIGFILFEAAYQAENVRGGLQAVGRGQYEAAQALGLSGPLTLSFIILPQALRAVIPAIFNSFISLFKDTSLVAIIGLFDILRIGRSVMAQSEWLGTHREVFLFAFFIYWGFNMAFTYGSRRMEETMGVGRR
jgi:general L-amino acid transport system permease protein